MESFGGLIELLVVFGFALGWGVLELLGHYLNRQSVAAPQGADDAVRCKSVQSSPESAGHPERQQSLHPPRSKSVE
jgi:hypothetical protein